MMHDDDICFEARKKLADELRKTRIALEDEIGSHRQTVRNALEDERKAGRQIQELRSNLEAEREAHRQTKAALKAQHELRVFLIEKMSAVRELLSRRPDAGMGDSFKYGYCSMQLDLVASEVEIFFNFIEGEERKDG